MTTAAVAVVAAALSLTGCSSSASKSAAGSTSSSSTPSASSSSSSAAAAPSSSSSAPPVRDPNTDLVIWTDAQRAPVLQQFAQSFAAANGISVSVQPVATDLQSAYVTATAAGKGPDIVVGATDWIGNLVQNGAIAPLPLTAAQKGSFQTTALSAVTYNGQVYGVPYATENLALITNTGQAPANPATFEDMVANGQAAVKAGKDSEALAMQIGQQGDPYTAQPLLGSAGGFIFGTKADGSYDPAQVGVDNAGSKAFAAQLAKYGEKGQNVFKRSIDANNAVSLFTSGKAPYLISGPWALEQIRKAGLKYAISPVPGFAGMGPSQPFVGVQAFYVSAKAKNTAIAQEFTLNYLTKKDVEEALYKVDPRAPALTEAYDDVSKTDPDIAAFQAAAAHGVVLPQIPAMSAVWGPLGIAEAAIVGGADPNTSMTNAATQIKAAIAKG
ncbi:extracellular solute-binding protein [Catenulispora sp. GP43]|uniref:sugar ABC transporter substrate-binding protein n=1 Tax=Catenulispora sp. GP43 TaxID=3156263 RepID=UPI003519C38D